MTTSDNKVYFYYLKTPEKDIWICRIARNFYEQGKTVCILSASQVHAELLDQLLWTFEQLSFVPHEIVSDAGSVTQSPVLICSQKVEHIHADVLIIARDISGSDIGFLSQFPIIVDFADLWDEYLKQLSRNRYKILNNLGYEVVTVEQPSV